ncbi:MAG: class C sortase [Clostridia bacterium]|nr:class C sortase [Clostridia bacterium]
MKKKFFFNFLIIVGIILISYPIISNFINGYTNTKVISRYEMNVDKLSEKEKENELRKAIEYNQELKMDTYIDVSLNSSKNEQLPNYINLLDLGNIIGYISIPKIDINLPIYHGISEDVLQNGVGHVDSSSLPVGGEGTHAVLAGHSGLAQIKVFDDIDKLEIDDIFYIKVLDNVLAYKVDNISIVEPDDTKAVSLEENKDYVTLVTCTPRVLNTHRLLVRGTRVYADEIENDRAKDSQNSMDAIRKYSESSFVSLVLSIIILILIILLIIVHFLNKVKDNVEKTENEKSSIDTDTISDDEQEDDEYVLITASEYNSKHLHERENKRKKPHQRNKDRKK